ALVIVAPFISHAQSQPPLVCCQMRSGFASPLTSPAPTILQSLPPPLVGSSRLSPIRLIPFMYQTARRPVLCCQIRSAFESPFMSATATIFQRLFDTELGL